MGDLIRIDGSYGEGGGQILRTSLTLSALTGKPFVIENIRIKREQPGLRPQHLTAVRAAAEICAARLSGAEVGSLELRFEPAGLKGGEFCFDVGTAGSTALVLQTVFLPLCFAGGSSEVILRGGTHNPMAPCYEYLEWQWLPMVKLMGYSASLAMKRPGFYPRGGGEMRLRVNGREPRLASRESPGKWTEAGPRPGTGDTQLHRPLSLLDRGELRYVRGLSAVARLPMSIAERQRRRAEHELQRLGTRVEIETKEVPSRSPGTYICLLAKFDHTSACCFSLGAPRKPAEQVGHEAASELLDFCRSEGAVDEHLADQLLLPAAVIEGETSYTTTTVTQHLLTNAYVIQQFTSARITIQNDKVLVRGHSLQHGDPPGVASDC